ncbi:phenol 2-monooxygenase [Rhodococcus fascians]|nr:phenol 2-monooxygenase [Rhodococcus sp. 3258]MDR6931848.1 phenol 2-monooxygenase [Rhodococcus fascians]
MLLAAQMSQYPTLSIRLVDRRAHRLTVGQADGIQARSVETFQAFGFADRIVSEAYRFCATNFWGPDPTRPGQIVRTRRTPDDPFEVSEFPHLTVNQARVLDYFAEAAYFGPGRIEPNFGWSFETLTQEPGEYPLQVSLRRMVDGHKTDERRLVKAKYVVGTDGSKSRVRESIGLRLEGDQAMHAWAVLDALTETDFPDIRFKCAIQSEHGSVLLIPREGGFLSRMYIDLGAVDSDDNGAIRSTTAAEAVAKANEVMAPFTLEAKDIPWFSVYEVGHRLADRFDDATVGETSVAQSARIFIAGDACHTHSAKAGQGMNVSMQDTYNLGWKLGQVLTGLSPESLLDTYTAERRDVAQNLIDYDREWSAMMARKPGEVPPSVLAEHLVKSSEFTAGFMTRYDSSCIVGDSVHQNSASGFEVGKRFRSAEVVRVSDAYPMHLGHHARADGRWRIYLFSDGKNEADSPRLSAWATWLLDSPGSPVETFTELGAEIDDLFDIKVIYQGLHHEVDLSDVPRMFFPRKGKFAVIDYEKVYAVAEHIDIFDVRGLDRGGVVVVVRPDQYVAAVIPLASEPTELTKFLANSMIPATERAARSGRSQ